MGRRAKRAPDHKTSGSTKRQRTDPTDGIDYPRNKYAIVFGYLGAGYHGMQRQSDDKEGVKTIENELEKAIIAAGGLSAVQVTNPGKMHWSRVGRTDKGVSAACQVVTVKLSLEGESKRARRKRERRERLQLSSKSSPGALAADHAGNELGEHYDDASTVEQAANSELCEPNASENGTVESELEPSAPPRCAGVSEADFAAALQSHLPPTFKVYGVCRVFTGFDARLSAEWRQYEYLLPTSVLRKVIARENSTAIETFFTRFYDEPGYEHFRRRWAECRTSLDMKKRVLSAMWGNLSDLRLRECYPLLGSNSPTKRLISDPELSDTLLKMRNEYSLLRSMYYELSPERRAECWNLLDNINKNADNVSSYPPFSLLSFVHPLCVQAELNKTSLSADELGQFEVIIRQLEGKHNWFNLTSRRKANDPSCYRFIYSIRVHEALDDPDLGQIIALRIVGQSFLLNQIRKIVSLAIEAYVGFAPTDAGHWMLSKPITPKKHCHLSPGEGLLLERAYFNLKNHSGFSMPAISDLVLHHPFEMDHPYGPKMARFLAEGLIEEKEHLRFPAGPFGSFLAAQRGENPTEYVEFKNCLLDDDEYGSESRCSTGTSPAASPESQREAQYVADWFDREAKWQPNFWKILKFKFDFLIPNMLKSFKDDDVWFRYMADLQWHPFFSENLPHPLERDIAADRSDNEE